MEPGKNGRYIRLRQMVKAGLSKYDHCFRQKVSFSL